MRISALVTALVFSFAMQVATAQSVGFQTALIAVAGGPPIPVDVWYPSDAQAGRQQLGLFQQVVAPDGPVYGMRLPLIVISHGNGGTKDGHYDTALALARAGFIVAALEHTGDNYRDQSRATDVLNRPLELHRLIDYMVTDWPRHAAINPNAIGAFGFSAGGFTVLAAAGGEPDLSLVAAHCAAHPHFYDCTLLAAHPPSQVSQQAVVHDPRIRALVVAAPALGFTFVHGLSKVTQPVQLWRADDDRVVPAPEYADAVRRALPAPPEFHTVAGAGHFDFLAPCTPELAKVAPPICTSQTGFDRNAFHQRFNEDVVAFFTAHLN